MIFAQAMRWNALPKMQDPTSKQKIGPVAG